ncbi:MAG: tetratricopeptide repeat protein [Saprospiraceae bacterium]|nr:tetratricopeptide repeat protein [Saprospiraceae bacterium]
MNIERLKQLEKFLKKEPNDPFLKYAIAMEWINEDIGKAKRYFEVLLEEHEEYVGTYYHAAKLYAELGESDRAEQIFKKGIIIAEKTGDHHALRELKSAYNEFLFDEDDED